MFHVDKLYASSLLHPTENVKHSAYVPVAESDTNNSQPLTNTLDNRLLFQHPEKASSDPIALYKSALPTATCHPATSAFSNLEPRSLGLSFSLLDDFYVNLVAWNWERLVLGVNRRVVLLHPGTGNTRPLYTMDAQWVHHRITSLTVSADEHFVIFGTTRGGVGFVESRLGKLCLRHVIANVGRICVLAAHPRLPLVAAGTKCGSIYLLNYRSGEIAELIGHNQEVCGLRWSNNGTQLVSGGNDSTVYVWRPDLGDLSATVCPFTSLPGHNAAVKSICWNPEMPHILASGAGSNDGCIRIFDTLTQQCLACISTGSQVCGVEWVDSTHLAISCGFSANTVNIWTWNVQTYALGQESLIAQHRCRALFLTASRDGKRLASVAPDGRTFVWCLSERRTAKDLDVCDLSGLFSRLAM
ncbi:WD domain, G-beta repeat [Carpediemonas membranifera]|uniref:WD domain, G-beta repeat n=1 Tax=Carpediemonas membranifera TaxID=201153 RepID=A0A8J6DZW7_9EUKA|nr:WD domain, G-beta repeat [Carpediemonas membranifera]|eukprot:KAG9391313.1 WD domain, G-beta repeat [Carpediemonas membranifera]